MEYSKVDISTIKPSDYNSRLHSDDQIERIANSIKEFGFINPILVGNEGEIIAGHGRYDAAIKLGLKEVPILYIEHLSDTQKRAYILADNRLAEMSEWDFSKYYDEIQNLMDSDFDIAIAGLDLDLDFGKLDDYAPEVEPNSDNREVTDLDISKASDKLDAKSTTITQTEVTCPACGEDFSISGR